MGYVVLVTLPRPSVATRETVEVTQEVCERLCPEEAGLNPGLNDMCAGSGHDPECELAQDQGRGGVHCTTRWKLHLGPEDPHRVARISCIHHHLPPCQNIQQEDALPPAAAAPPPGGAPGGG